MNPEPKEAWWDGKSLRIQASFLFKGNEDGGEEGHRLIDELVSEARLRTLQEAREVVKAIKSKQQEVDYGTKYYMTALSDILSALDNLMKL